MQPIPIATQIEWTSPPGPEQGQVAIGRLEMLGGWFHVTAIRVHMAGEEQRPVDDPHGHWSDYEGLPYDGTFATVPLPGLDGDWAVFVEPYQS
jgi:hypothetical protein